MFQEINRYSNNTNQTYLIDSGVNTSQLRRKHHFMVLLKSLKFKFQLFIINLLNHRQLANFFDSLNRDKQLLRAYYDLKMVSSMSHNASGDSGLMSNSNSSSLSTSSMYGGVNGSGSVADNSGPSNDSSTSLSIIESLNNVSIFENDEYFSYLHKLLQQFSYIDFNLQIFKDQSPPISQQQVRGNSIKATRSKSHHTEARTPTMAKLVGDNSKPIPPQRRISSSKRNGVYEPTTLLSKYNFNPSGIEAKNSNFNKSSHTITSSTDISTNKLNDKHLPSTPNVGSKIDYSNTFTLKNISKKLNIKSWFSSSNSTNSHLNSQQQVNGTTNVSKQSSSKQNTNFQRLNHHLQPSATISNHFLSSQSSISQMGSSSGSSSFSGNNGRKGNAPVAPSTTTTTTKSNKYKLNSIKKQQQLNINETKNQMKHSLSEPSLNEIVNNDHN
jgi:hypothetical protein